jgi:hypothetical protein
MNNERFIDKIKDELGYKASSDLVRINNAYADRYFGNKIFENNDQFLTEHYNERAAELARAITYGKYRYVHKWVYFDAYNNLISLEYVSATDLCASPEKIAQFVADRFQEFEDLFNFDEEE